MNTISQAYKSVYLNEKNTDLDFTEIAIILAAIGQRIKMGNIRYLDGDTLIDIAKKLEKTPL